MCQQNAVAIKTKPDSNTHLRAHETALDLVCRTLLEKKKRLMLEKKKAINTKQISANKTRNEQLQKANNANIDRTPTKYANEILS